MKSSLLGALEQAPSLVEVLRLWATEAPEHRWLTFFGQDVTTADLWRRSLTASANLHRLGIRRGDRVCLVFPSCPEFFSTYFGIMALGAVPITLYPTLGPEAMGRIFVNSEARAVVTIEWFGTHVEAARGHAPRTERLIWAHELEAEAPEAPIPPIDADDLAFVQYTSGSTGHPKGVMLRHRNLLANIRTFVTFARLGPGEVVVSWLPLYHDMGLIGCSLGSLYGGGRLILLPPDLKNPRAWLEAITTYRGSITVSPDFGYRNCMRNIHDLEGLDLSCLRLAFSGAEPVRLSTIEGFEGRFGLKHVVSPAYGLAEATLAVAAHRPGEPLRLDPSGKWVSVGQPLPGIEVAIWQGGAFLSPGEVGEIVVRTPAVMQGYYGDPEGTASAFRSGWLHTGDLGFVDREGYLYVTGRDKDLIVVGGQNLVPGDVETVVDSIPEIRYSAAVGLDVERMGTQQLVVVAELREEGIDHDACSHLVRQITAEVHRQLGFRPGRVLLVSKHAIPLTSSGKIQHGRLVELIASGEFREQILYPPRLAPR